MYRWTHNVLSEASLVIYLKLHILAFVNYMDFHRLKYGFHGNLNERMYFIFLSYGNGLCYHGKYTSIPSKTFRSYLFVISRISILECFHTIIY